MNIINLSYNNDILRIKLSFNEFVWKVIWKYPPGSHKEAKSAGKALLQSPIKFLVNKMILFDDIINFCQVY